MSTATAAGAPTNDTFNALGKDDRLFDTLHDGDWGQRWHTCSTFDLISGGRHGVCVCVGGRGGSTHSTDELHDTLEFKFK